MSKRQIVQLVAIGALLTAATLLSYALRAAGIVYGEHELALSLLALGLLGLTLLFALALAILAVVRIVQKHYLFGAALLVLCCIPFFMPNVISGPYWKFLVNKSAYLSIIQADQSVAPKYRVFNWGDRLTGPVIGGGNIFEAIVYDQTDDIARDPKSRSRNWQTERSLVWPPQDQWVTAIPPDCPRTIQAFGDHFYYVVMVC